MSFKFLCIQIVPLFESLLYSRGDNKKLLNFLICFDTSWRYEGVLEHIVWNKIFWETSETSVDAKVVTNPVNVFNELERPGQRRFHLAYYEDWVREHPTPQPVSLSTVTRNPISEMYINVRKFISTVLLLHCILLSSNLWSTKFFWSRQYY